MLSSSRPTSSRAASSAEKVQLVLNAQAEKTPIVGIARTFGTGRVRRNALFKTLLPYEGNDEVVMDGLWTFVACKKNDVRPGAW